MSRAAPSRHDQSAREREVDAITRAMQAGCKPA